VDKRINGIPAQTLEKLSTVNRKDRKGPGNRFGSPENMKKVTKSRAAHTLTIKELPVKSDTIK
jgi:hypothetical protein